MKLWFSTLFLVCLFNSLTSETKYAKELMKIMKGLSRSTYINNDSTIVDNNSKGNVTNDMIKINIQNKTNFNSIILQDTTRKNVKNSQKNDQVLQGGFWKCNGIWNSKTALSDKRNLQGWFIGNCSGFSNVTGKWSAKAVNGSWIEEENNNTNSDNKMYLNLNARAVLNNKISRRKKNFVLSRTLSSNDYRRHSNHLRKNSNHNNSKKVVNIVKNSNPSHNYRKLHNHNNSKKVANIVKNSNTSHNYRKLHKVRKQLKMKPSLSERNRKNLSTSKKPRKIGATRVGTIKSF